MATLEAEDARFADLEARLQAAGVHAPACQLPGLAEDDEQIRAMAATLRSAEDPISWSLKR